MPSNLPSFHIIPKTGPNAEILPQAHENKKKKINSQALQRGWPPDLNGGSTGLTHREKGGEGVRTKGKKVLIF